MKSAKAIDPVEFTRARIEGCRKGGRKSGLTRRATARRVEVELAIRDREARNCYGRSGAVRIGEYLGVSARYVRKIKAALDAERKTELELS